MKRYLYIFNDFYSIVNNPFAFMGMHASHFLIWSFLNIRQVCHQTWKSWLARNPSPFFQSPRTEPCLLHKSLSFQTSWENNGFWDEASQTFTFLVNGWYCWEMMDSWCSSHCQKTDSGSHYWRCWRENELCVTLKLEMSGAFIISIHHMLQSLR